MSHYVSLKSNLVHCPEITNLKLFIPFDVRLELMVWLCTSLFNAFCYWSKYLLSSSRLILFSRLVLLLPMSCLVFLFFSFPSDRALHTALRNLCLAFYEGARTSWATPLPNCPKIQCHNFNCSIEKRCGNEAFSKSKQKVSSRSRDIWRKIELFCTIFVCLARDFEHRL